MLRFIKNTILLTLVISVVLLAMRIHERTPEREFDLAKTKSLVKRNIGELQKKAGKKAQAMEEILQKVRATRGVGVAVQDMARKNAGAKNEQGASHLATKETRESGVSIDPLDEEDRKLTGEILFGEERTATATKTSEDDASPSALQAIVSQGNTCEPLDLDRLAEIRELYSQSLEALDFY